MPGKLRGVNAKTKKDVGKIHNFGFKHRKMPILYKEMDNTESFVAFADKTKAHYECMKEDDNQRALDKTFE